MLFLKIFKNWRGRRRWNKVSRYYNDEFVKIIKHNGGFSLGTMLIPIIYQKWIPEKTEGTYIYNDLRKILERLNLLEEL